MTVGQQRRTIAVSSMVVFGLGFLKAAHESEVPNARFLIGIGFTYTFISVVADMGGGDFAAGFAILILIAAVLYEGEDIMELLTKRSAGKVEANKKKKSKANSTAHAQALGGMDGLEGAGSTTTPEALGDFERSNRQKLARPTRLVRR